MTRPTGSPTVRPARRDLWLGQLLLPALAGCLLLLIGLGFDAQNGVRTYVGGESLWSKGQKAAVRALHIYAATGRDGAFADYQRALAVPMAYEDGRREMDRPGADVDYVVRRMVAGGTHPADAPSAFRLYRWFGWMPQLDAAVRVWTAGDREIAILRAQADTLRSLVRAGAPDAARARLLDAIDRTDARLTVHEERFSAVLGDGARFLSTTVTVLVGVTALLLAWIGSLLTARLVRHARAAAEAEAARARDARALLDNAADTIARFDRRGRMMYGNPAVQRALGVAVSELIGSSATPPGMPPAFVRLWRDALRTVYREGRSVTLEFAYPTPEGERHFHTTITPERGADGYVETALAIGRDVTEIRRSEQALRERETQIRQMQKVEAVGRLAGGVAHDFNNLLTVIRMSVELLGEEIPTGDAKRQDVDDIRAAAERAASLTRQLLAYSRRQVMLPEVLDLNSVVSALGPMVRRLIGEDIAVEEVLSGTLGPVRADRGQVEQVIVNLAVNARDAMPGGGRLHVATANVTLAPGESPSDEFSLPPGDYVRLTVSDTGHGMDPETRARVFEPFFTTKGPGQGTGLGLSTVYGIVKQSGGYVWCESTPGEGSCFVVLLPHAAAAADAPARRAAAEPAAAGTETVLLAEDEDAVRALARRVLERQGYRVLCARDGADALRVAAEYGHPVDLLVTDLVMPVLGGRGLALQLRARQADVPVLFMSGYTDDDIVRRGALEPGTTFMQKPFTAEGLSRAVRETLDRRRAAA